MADNQIGLVISDKELAFKIGSENNSFPVVVVNGSDQFASFQIELIAAGTNNQPIDYEWYKISPDTSVKIPPGDSVEFRVAIIETPIPGFSGIMNVTVRAFSMELREEEREILKVNLQEGEGRSQLKLEAPSQKIQATPLDNVEISVFIGNPSQQFTNVTLSCLDLPESWFPKGSSQQFQLRPGEKLTASFLCTIPFDIEAIAKTYPFTVYASHTNGLPSKQQASIEILPRGYVEVECSPKSQNIPAKLAWKFWQSPPATFEINANNASNTNQVVDFDLQNINASEVQDFAFEVLPNNAAVEPFSVVQHNLTFKKSRPWFGNAKRFSLLLKSNWQDTRVNNRNETQTIEVRVKPVIPTFFVILLILLIAIPTWYLSPLNPTNPFPPHLSAVTSVQFEGSGTRAISSSNDRTMRKWFVDGFDKWWINQDIGVIAETNKAIRIARFRPVNNDMFAAGLENGEIQIWNYSNGNDRILAKFSAQSDDRVFGLEYTLDSRTLFSGHGSGAVLRWDLQNLFTSPPTQPSQTKKFDFSVTSIALVGDDDTTLAIAGRYNQLVLWNWVNDTVKKVPYPKNGGQDDYIQSIAVAARKRNILAATDNQGYMSVWDLSACLKSDRPCQMLDGWENGHHGKPVLAAALSEEGCYLLSGGDDGEIKLWPLTGNGKRVGSLLDGTTLEVRPYGATGVDIHLDGDSILTVVGTRAGRVVGHKVDRLYRLGCDKKQ